MTRLAKPNHQKRARHLNEGAMGTKEVAEKTGTTKLPSVESPHKIPTLKQRQDLSDATVQERYWQAYRLQQARRSCPGCGDSGLPL
jgi:hypothetical protein